MWLVQLGSTDGICDEMGQLIILSEYVASGVSGSDASGYFLY